MAVIISAISTRFKCALNLSNQAPPCVVAPASLIQIGYIIPHFSYGVTLLDFFFKNGASKFLGLKSELAYIALGSSVVFWYVMYEYFDSIIPNAYGISKGFCCCISSCFKDKANMTHDIHDQSGLYG